MDKIVQIVATTDHKGVGIVIGLSETGEVKPVWSASQMYAQEVVPQPEEVKAPETVSPEQEVQVVETSQV